MEKKIMNRSFLFAILALVAGVFYREFTKFNGFVGRTTLAFMHPHFLMMGTFFLIILVIFFKNFKVFDKKKFEKHFYIYSIGLIFTVIMMLVRGVTQVLNISLTLGQDKAISGIAGIAHIIFGVTFIMILNDMKKSIK